MAKAIGISRSCFWVKKMSVSGKHGQGRTGSEVACSTSSLEEIVHTIVELAGMCAESARAGGDAWYEVSVYVHPRGLRYQVQRHGSVVGGNSPPPALQERNFDLLHAK
ncbi:MAG: hypothetical protein KGH57_01220 [Candidatus Micrarchaeota archaeon]|nr:hypothetical protein [Candidatus Micrarchaeota archaeon]